MGAKRIGFVGVPPLGCCPSQITLGGSPSRQCEPLRNRASRLFNSRISQEIEILNAERSASGSKIAYFDIYYNLLDLIQNPALYGKFYAVTLFIYLCAELIILRSETSFHSMGKKM
jgi:hypothetical protein